MSLADHRYLTEATGKNLLRALETFNTGAATTTAPTSDDEPRLITDATGDDIADELVDALGNLLHIFALEYDSATVYQSGAFCTHAGKYYQRKSWGSTTPAAESWTAAHWTQKTLADIVSALQTAIDNATKIDDTAGAGDTNKTWSADKIAAAIDDLIVASASEPGGDTKLWIKDHETEYEIPTMSNLEAIKEMTIANAAYHMGFYRDAQGDICEID